MFAELFQNEKYGMKASNNMVMLLCDCRNAFQNLCTAGWVPRVLLVSWSCSQTNHSRASGALLGSQL